jgi:hypothetical protein
MVTVALSNRTSRSSACLMCSCQSVMSWLFAGIICHAHDFVGLHRSFKAALMTCSGKI